MRAEKTPLLPETWDDLEKILKQKAELALDRIEQALQKVDETVALVKAVGQDSAQLAVKEAKEAFLLAKRVDVEKNIKDLRKQAEDRIQEFADSLEQRREQEIAKQVEALRKRLMQRDEDRIVARRVKEAGKVEARVEKILTRLENIEQKTEESVPAASAALQLGLQVTKQVGVGKLARRAARQADARGRPARQARGRRPAGREARGRRLGPRQRVLRGTDVTGGLGRPRRTQPGRRHGGHRRQQLAPPHAAFLRIRQLSLSPAGQSRQRSSAAMAYHRAYRCRATARSTFSHPDFSAF